MGLELALGVGMDTRLVLNRAPSTIYCLDGGGRRAGFIRCFLCCYETRLFFVSLILVPETTGE